MNKFLEHIRNYTLNKNVCLLGYGREGKSTYHLLKEYCKCNSITICDKNNIDRITNEIPKNIKIVSGEQYQDKLNSFDIVFKSPGIVLNDDIDMLTCEITSETQIFFECFRDQIVGITGTKGKSTVSSLIYHVLKKSGVPCLFAGNIGIPVFDIAAEVNDKSIIVCELSCHQLEYMTVSPKISVLLNLYEEHLDHYCTMEKYSAAKKNIYNYQKSGDRLFCNFDILPDNIESAVFSISDTNRKADFFVENASLTCNMGPVYKIPTDHLNLLGVHNHYNIAIAYLVCQLYAISDDEFNSALCTFNPLAHRLEFVQEVNGVRYYDDSISTACATAIEAIKSVPTPGTILIGGMDRGIDYTDLINYLNESDINVICMEKSGKRIYDTICSLDFKSPERIYYTEHLEEAVKLAADITKTGYSCVLSPAAASYGIFKNFEERGNVFKELVKNLK